MPNLFECTGSSSCGNKVIYLGRGTSFNVRELVPDIDYTSLTSDNFIAEIVDWPRTTNSTNGGEISSYVDAIVNASTMTKTYDNLSGIFTIDNAYFRAGAKSRGASTSATSNLVIDVYLITEEIEK